MIKKFKGFTLGEILIAMGVIAIVASLTLPQLVNGQKAAQGRAQFDTAYSLIAKSIADMDADNISVLPSSYTTSQSLYKALKNYHRVTIDCGDYSAANKNTSVCIGYSGGNTNDKFDNYYIYNKNSQTKAYMNLFDDGSFVINNGMLIAFENPGGVTNGNPNPMFISVDINGKNKLPNRYGWDLFTFELTKTGLLPLGADHLALCDNLQAQISEVNKYLRGYEILLGSPFDYLKNLTFEKKVTSEQRSNARNFILPGVYSSRIDIKRANSALEWNLFRIGEPFAAIMNYLGKTKNYQPIFDYCTDILLQNHPHDSIYGCSLDEVHSENLTRCAKAQQAVNSVKNSIFRDIYSEKEVRVFNFSNYHQSGVFKIFSDKKFDAQLVGKHKGFPFMKVFPTNAIPVTEDFTDIYEYLFFADAEPFSCTKPVNPPSDLSIGGNFIENSYLKLEIEQGKINITDKISGKSYCDFLKITDRADIGDSYNFGALKGDKKITARICGSKILENGPCRAALEVAFSINIPVSSDEIGRSGDCLEHILKMVIYLESGGKYLEFSLDWENKAKNHILQAEFEFEKPVQKTISDDLCGVVEREFDSDYDIYENIPAPRGIELKYNTAPAQSFVCTQNAGIFSDRYIEYEVFKNSLSLTLLRATGVISNPKNPTRGTPAGPPLPTPELQMLGKCSDRFALTFDSPNMYKYSENFKGALVGLLSDFESERLFYSGDEHIAAISVKSSPKNDLIIRFMNISDEPKYFDFVTKLPYKEIKILNPLDEPVEEYKPLMLESRGIIAISLSC